MTEDKDGGAAHDPEDGGDGRSEPQQRDAETEETGVEAFLRYDVLAGLEGLRRCAAAFSHRSCAPEKDRQTHQSG